MSVKISNIGQSYTVASLAYNARYKGEIRLKVNSVNENTNTSSVTVSWVYIKTAYDKYNAYNLSGSSSVSLNINGTNYTGTADFDLRTASTGSSQVIYSKTVTINHDSDGGKNIDVSGSHITGISWGTHSLSATTVELIDIKRASTISLNKTSLEINGTNSITVNITRATTNYTHKVVFELGTKSQTYIGVTTSKTFTVPLSWNEAVTTSTEKTATVKVYTYNGSVLMGTAEDSFVAKVPASVVPTIGSFTSERIDGGVPSDWGVYVKGVSKVLLTVTGAAGSYNSTIKSYKITGDGYTGNSSVLTTGVINSNGTVSYTATVTDSRGRTASQTISIGVYYYGIPKITDETAVNRCKSNGEIIHTGTYIKVKPVVGFASVDLKNNVTITGRLFNSSFSQNYTFTNNQEVIIGGNLDIDQNYTLELTLSDEFNTVKRQYNIPIAYSTMEIYKTGKGIAFGKNAQYVNLFDVGMPARFTEGISTTPIPANSNLNDYVVAGFYYALGSSSVLNAPVSNVTTSFLIMSPNNPVFATQIASVTNTGKIYIRSKFGGNWTNWTQLN